MLPKNPSNLGTKASDQNEAMLRRRFPPLKEVKSLTAPCILVDRHGIILAWYLPGILSDYRQVAIPFPLSDLSGISDASQNTMLEAQKKLRPSLKQPQSGGCWRNDSQYFNSEGEGTPGTVTLSPAWFPQAHDVSPSAD